MGDQRRWSRLAAVVALALSSAACTVVRIEGTADLSRHFGVLQISPGPGNSTIIVDTQGFGVVPSMHGLTLGESHERAVYLANASDCRAVFFVETEAEAARILALLDAHDSKSVCSNQGPQ